MRVSLHPGPLPVPPAFRRLAPGMLTCQVTHPMSRSKAIIFSKSHPWGLCLVRFKGLMPGRRPGRDAGTVLSPPSLPLTPSPNSSADAPPACLLTRPSFPLVSIIRQQPLAACPPRRFSPGAGLQLPSSPLLLLQGCLSAPGVNHRLWLQGLPKSALPPSLLSPLMSPARRYVSGTVQSYDPV